MLSNKAGKQDTGSIASGVLSSLTSSELQIISVPGQESFRCVKN